MYCCLLLQIYLCYLWLLLCSRVTLIQRMFCFVQYVANSSNSQTVIISNAERCLYTDYSTLETMEDDCFTITRTSWLTPLTKPFWWWLSVFRLFCFFCRLLRAFFSSFAITSSNSWQMVWVESFSFRSHMSSWTRGLLKPFITMLRNKIHWSITHMKDQNIAHTV